MEEPEVSAAIGSMIVHAAERRGVDGAELRRRSGFELTAVGPDVRIPLSVETRLWDEASSLSGDPIFGVYAAQSLLPGTFDVLDYAVRTAPTFRESIQRVIRYNRIVHDVAVWSLHERDGIGRIEHSLIQRPGSPFRVAPDNTERTQHTVGLGLVTQSRHAAEFTIASIATIGSQLCGVNIRPREVEFRHSTPSPEVVTAHERFFGVRPSYGCRVNAFVLDTADLDRPILGADSALSRIIERHADALLASRPEPAESTAARVRRLLAQTLAEDLQQAKLSAIAPRLHMSARSLQRRLTAEGVSFDALLEDVRRELALQYLRDHEVPIAEVAFLLGYSEPSAFHRAFKRWTGVTPAQVRSQAA